MRFLKSSLNNPRGLTLLEIMVVLAIITGVVALVIPRIGNQNNQMKAAVRRMMVLSKQLQATARLQGAAYRIVFELPEREEDQQYYWIERSNSSILLPKDKNILSDARKKLEDEKKDKKDEETSPSSEGFSMDTSILKGKQTLPSGMRFKSIEVVGLDRPIETGYAFIHYHPAGLVEEAAIHLKYGEKHKDGQIGRAHV